jgi:hypothetical protein
MASLQHKPEVLGARLVLQAFLAQATQLVPALKRHGHRDHAV